MVTDIIIIIFLMVAAVFLILAEIFLLPGITIAGIGGILFAVGGIIFAYSVNAMTGNITVISSVLIFGGVFFRLLRRDSFSRVSLKTDIDSTISSPKDKNLHVGDKGVTLSRLAPIGKARFNNITVEAKSVNEFVDENTPVVITGIEGFSVTVENINNINI
ncbi:MAG: NfeD family protein [Tannerella sp.]|jgi:membrane-bound ClpP family serine protease|nr:NfeD family protein [Tannerella sp.]